MHIPHTIRRGGAALALALALATPGFAAGNQGLLEPIGAIGNFMDDAGITTEVKARLLAQKGLDGLDIHVTTEKGVVTLSGLVDHAAQIDLAGRIAADPSNVKGVKNDLRLRR